MESLELRVRFNVENKKYLGPIHEAEFKGHKPALLTTGELIQCVGEYISNETLPVFIQKGDPEDPEETMP